MRKCLWHKLLRYVFVAVLDNACLVSRPYYIAYNNPVKAAGCGTNGLYLGVPLVGLGMCADSLDNHSIEASE